MAPAQSLVDLIQTNPYLLACAGALVRSKPSELTPREYLALLKLHDAKGRRDQALSSTHRHLDKSSWWHSRYERERDENAALRSEMIDLKLEHDRLKAKLEDRSPARKRKKVDGDIVPVPPSPKRTKVVNSPAKRDPASAEAIAQFDFTSLGEAGSILMQSFYQINATLKSTQKTEPATLAYHCVRAASAVSQVVQRALQDVESTAESGIDSLKLVLTASSRAILSLVMAFNRLSNIAEAAQVQGKVTYAYVKMYERLADMITESSKSEALKAIRVEPSAPVGKRSLPSKPGAKQPTKPGKNRPNHVLALLTKFLCDIVDRLDPKIEAHKSLFEGFAYVVFERLGSCLYIATFGHRRGETMEHEIALANIQDGIEDDAESRSEELTMAAAKLEAPSLIHLLDRIMTQAPAQLGSLIETKTGEAKSTNSDGSMKGALAIEAKTRLQRTLVNCMFGAEGLEKDSQWLDCLKVPVILDVPLPVPKLKDTAVLEWFSEEVWKQLGWEVLSGEFE